MKRENPIVRDSWILVLDMGSSSARAWLYDQEAGKGLEPWSEVTSLIHSDDGTESGDHAREAAPGKIQSLGHLVGLRDFESAVLATSVMAKAPMR